MLLCVNKLFMRVIYIKSPHIYRNDKYVKSDFSISNITCAYFRASRRTLVTVGSITQYRVFCKRLLFDNYRKLIYNQFYFNLSI